MSNPLLDIPFDEADGSNIAYDLGAGHHHAAIDMGRFIPGKFGNCVYFASEGKAEIIPHIFDFSQDFTFMVWVKADASASGPTRSYVNLKFPGENNVKEVELFSPLLYWSHFCITQEGNLVKVYLDGELKGTVPITVAMTGFALLNNAPHDTAGFSSLDGGKSYSTAVPPTEIIDIIQNELQPVEIHVNGVNFKSLGVIVEKIEGVLDMPERKDPLTFDWGDYHGEVVDLMKPVFGVREFQLRCWIKASSKEDLIQKWVTFKSYFEQPGTQRIQLDAGSKPLVFEAYHKDRLEIENKWRDGVLFGRFTLKLREPEPVKRVLKVNGSSCTITVSSKKLLSVHWGDGSKTMNVYGSGKTVSHTYSGAGEYYVVVAGNIEDITSFSTDAAIVWGRI